MLISRQILCFEQPANAKTKPSQETVRGLFRALMPIFNNQNKSVITPLLATGSQVGKIELNNFVNVNMIKGRLRMD